MEINPIILAVGSMIFFGVGGFLTKYLLADIEPVTLYLGEFVVGLFLLLMFLLLTNTPLNLEKLTAANYAGIFVLSAIFFFAILMFYHALAKSDASKVMPIVNLNTLIVVALAVIILGEKLSINTKAAIVLSIIAIYLFSIETG